MTRCVRSPRSTAVGASPVGKVPFLNLCITSRRFRLTLTISLGALSLGAVALMLRWLL